MRFTGSKFLALINQKKSLPVEIEPDKLEKLFGTNWQFSSVKT